jgi:hypothetical protein
MSEIERKKYNILEQLQNLCAHCATKNEHHNCPIQEIALRIERLQGVPLMVNAQFKGMLWNK